MRVWVDLTNSPHVLVMRPLIEVDARGRARGRGDRARLRADARAVRALRDRAHGRRAATAAGGSPARRSGWPRAAPRWCAGRGGRRFDVAIGHGSNDVSVAAKLLRVPSATSFDYEWATAQHQVNCRLARAVVVPDAIPPERLERYGARGKIHAYPGLKEEYYLADFEPDPAVLDELGLDRERPLVVVRTPPEVSLYHRFENPLFARVLERLAASDAQTVVLPRTPAQRAELAGAGSSCPSTPIDAQSLVAYADLVISAGGTMNREAVALGTPVFTTFEGRLGAVDEALLREGRLRKLEDPGQIELGRRPANGGLRVRRDPRELVKMLLAAREP